MLTPVSLPDLDLIPELTLFLIPIEFEIEPPILDSHILMMEKECEFQCFDLDPTFEPNPTSNLNLFESHSRASISFRSFHSGGQIINFIESHFFVRSRYRP